MLSSAWAPGCLAVPSASQRPDRCTEREWAALLAGGSHGGHAPEYIAFVYTGFWVLPGPGTVGRQQLRELLGGGHAHCGSPVTLSVPVSRCTEVLPALPSLWLLLVRSAWDPPVASPSSCSPCGFQQRCHCFHGLHLGTMLFSLLLQHPGFPSAQFSIATDGSLVPTCVSGEVPGTQ